MTEVAIEVIEVVGLVTITVIAHYTVHCNGRSCDRSSRPSNSSSSSSILHCKRLAVATKASSVARSLKLIHVDLGQYLDG